MAWNATRELPLKLVYDGSCRFCTAGSERVLKMAAPGLVRRVSNKDEAEMAAFPASVRAGIGDAMQLVSADGEIASGAEAVNRVLATRGVWRLVTWVYWVPGIKQINDWVYRTVARNRYRIMGRVPDQSCDTGTCGVGTGRA